MPARSPAPVCPRAGAGWIGGTLLLALSKILEKLELGHTSAGNTGRMRDPTWTAADEWASPAPAKTGAKTKTTSTTPGPTCAA